MKKLNDMKTEAKAVASNAFVRRCRGYCRSFEE